MAPEAAAVPFSEYASDFRREAGAAGRDDHFITACLAYAEQLWATGVPPIYDVEHLAALVGYTTKYVIAAAYGGLAFYRSYSVSKKAGGIREIREPLPSLKEIQRWILDNVLAHVPISRYAKGFRAATSIKDAARFHRRQSLVIALDLVDFFPSIKRPRVFGVFRRLGYAKEVSNILARLCCLEGSLPQGAPTSPALSNIVCRRLDARLGGYAKQFHLRYTRYADDIALSGDAKAGDIIGAVRKIARAEGFALHPRKINVMQRHQRQIVTGIVVNDKMQASRILRREVRQAVFYIRKYGVESHLERTRETRTNYLEHLIGLTAFVLFVNPRDEQARADLQFLRECQSGDE